MNESLEINKVKNGYTVVPAYGHKGGFSRNEDVHVFESFEALAAFLKKTFFRRGHTGGENCDGRRNWGAAFMSYAFRARKKAIKRAKDSEDPERKVIRNAIRNGQAPRLTSVQDRIGAKTRVTSAWDEIKKKLSARALTFRVVRRRIAFSTGIILGREKTK